MEGAYDNWRLHCAQFYHDVHFCAGFYGCVRSGRGDGPDETILMVGWYLIELEKLQTVSVTNGRKRDRGIGL